MPERITAAQFVEKLRDASEWALDVKLGSNDLIIHVREDNEITTFYGPDLLDLSEVEVQIFLADVRKVSNIRSRERMY